VEGLFFRGRAAQLEQYMIHLQIVRDCATIICGDGFGAGVAAQLN
jgi:hypothetical protein